MSYAPSFGAPGGHIFDVVAQGLKKHIFDSQREQKLNGNQKFTEEPREQ